MNRAVLSFLQKFCLIGVVSGVACLCAHAIDLGQVADNMMEPVGLVSDFVYSACFAIGGAIVFASVIKYFEHRRSPLMVSLGTVAFLFFIGLAFILLPFLSLMVEGGVRYSFFK